MVSIATVDSLLERAALSPAPHAYSLSLGSALLSQSCLSQICISPHVRTQAKIIENTNLTPPKSLAIAYLPVHRNCKAHGSPFVN